MSALTSSNIASRDVMLFFPKALTTILFAHAAWEKTQGLSGFAKRIASPVVRSRCHAASCAERLLRFAAKPVLLLAITG
jgi:hypothetical protein